MHLMIDTVVIHTLDVRIPDCAIEERRKEWDSLTGHCRCRADYIKGLLAFCGIELMDYHNAQVQRSATVAGYEVAVRSKYWADRQPR